MKKIFYFIALSAALLCSSCAEDALEVAPTDQVSADTMLNTTEGGMMALNGTIRFFWQWGVSTTGNYHQCFGPQSYALMGDLMGEDFVQAAQGSGWFWYDYTYGVKSRFATSTWRSYDCWNYYYTLISQCNQIIAAEELMTGSEADINYVMGNAYALRAYAYHYLAMTFARSYIGHENMLCVPLFLEPASAQSVGRPRSTNKEVYAQIVSDINKACTLLAGQNQKHSSHIDQYVANGIKARVALYMGDYQTAYDAAAIAVKGGSYAFDKNFTFNDASDKSVLWGAEIIRDQGTTNPQFLAHMDYRFDGYGNTARKCCSYWLYDMMGKNDARRGWWNEEVLYDGKTKGLQQYKFLFSDPKDTYVGADHIFMRAPEMQLVLAECACRLGKESEAKAFLADLMKTRDADYTCDKTGTALGALTTDLTGSLLEEILIQRRIELWGEYGRIYDIKRLRQGFVRTAEMGHPSTGITAGNTLAWDDPESFDWVLTIPQTEINANPHIVQNPVGSYASGEQGDDPSLYKAPASEE